MSPMATPLRVLNTQYKTLVSICSCSCHTHDDSTDAYQCTYLACISKCHTKENVNNTLGLFSSLKISTFSLYAGVSNSVVVSINIKANIYRFKYTLFSSKLPSFDISTILHLGYNTIF